MTAQILPFAGMQNMDPAMMQEMLKQMAAMQHEQRLQLQAQKQKQNNWRNLTKRDSGMDSMMGLALGMMLFGGLFDGSSMFQGLGNMAQSFEGLGEIGLMNMAESANTPNAPTNIMDRTPVRSAPKQSGGSDMMSFLMLVMIMKMMSQHNEERGETGGGSGEMFAMDALARHPKLMQYKRDREHIVGSNKNRFRSQMTDMVAPRRAAAPRLAM
jgi:hypothetical protein